MERCVNWLMGQSAGLAAVLHVTHRPAFKHRNLLQREQGAEMWALRAGRSRVPYIYWASLV